MLDMRLCGRVEYLVCDNMIEVFWKCFPHLSHFPFLWQYLASDVHVEDVAGLLSEFTHV